MKEVRKQIVAMAEPEYQEFSAGLLPGTENILGVRLPNLRKLAKQIVKSDGSSLPDWRSFERMETYYFEEIMLQGFVLGYVKVSGKAACEELLSYIAAFVPKIDNWSVCDSFCSSLKFTREYQERVWQFLKPFLHADKEYEVRFGIVMLLFYYIEDKYIDEVLDILKIRRHEAYYVKMAVAWTLSMCYVKYEKKVEAILAEKELDEFTHNKTIQKICESRQIEVEKKKKIRQLKFASL